MTEPAGPPPPEHPLLAAIQQWAQKTLPAPPSGHGGPECQWCPLCQVASMLRGEHPELTERVAEAGAALATAFTALVESAARAGSDADPDAADPDANGHGPTTAKRPARDAPQPRPRVERITLDDPERTD